MGTNYYLNIPTGRVCPTCLHQKPSKSLHIGKSSRGWVFALRVYPEQGINTLDDWIPLLDTGVIRDEYDEEFSKNDLINIITDRLWLATWPHGLLRSKVDGVHCVGHGPGTYDYFVGNFS